MDSATLEMGRRNIMSKSILRLSQEQTMKTSEMLHAFILSKTYAMLMDDNFIPFTNNADKVVQLYKWEHNIK